MRWQWNSWLEEEGLDLSEEELYNMKITKKQNLPIIRSLDAFVNSFSHYMCCFI